MMANTLPGEPLTLGGFLRDRRARLRPAPGAPSRRRTPGLRREEVATGAGVSVQWYTWLEQGRGGPPSVEVLERLARALELDAAGREVLFLLARQQPPVRPRSVSPVPPGLQRVLDAVASPAIVKTPSWDVVAWNAAAIAALTDYAALPERERNVLRHLFDDPASRERLPDWEENARFALAVLRVDAARAGGGPEAPALAAELQARSADFRRLWAENGMESHAGHRKRLRHPVAGLIAFDCATFAIEGADGLTMIVFTPATPADVQAVTQLLIDKA